MKTLAKKPRRGGARHHPLFRRWTHIRQCFNDPNSKEQKYIQQYNITCDWTSFWEFADDIELHLGLPPTAEHKLHRRNLYKGWSVNNLYWCDQKTVGQTQRNTNMIKYRGKTQCLSAWCEELNASYWRVYRRYHQGMKPKDIFK